jgi:hypothetical protein
MEKKLIQFDQSAENNNENIGLRSKNAKTFYDSSNFINYSTRDSLDNNPFDRALKELRLQDDPFEIKTLPAKTGHQHVPLEKLIDFEPEQQMGTILEDHTDTIKQTVEDVSHQVNSYFFLHYFSLKKNNPRQTFLR